MYLAVPCWELQDLKTLDVTKLTPLSPDVISRQATINIGELRWGAAAGLHGAQGWRFCA